MPSAKVRKWSNECESEKQLVKCQWLGLALTVCGARGTLAVVHCRRHRLRPKYRLAPREPMCRISAQFEHASIRSHSRGNASIIFRTGTQTEADHLGKIFCWRLRSRTGGIFRSLFIYRRASAYSSNFWKAITLELRASLLAGDPHGPREAFFVFVFLCVFVFAWFCTKLK